MMSFSFPKNEGMISTRPHRQPIQQRNNYDAHHSCQQPQHQRPPRGRRRSISRKTTRQQILSISSSNGRFLRFCAAAITVLLVGKSNGYSVPISTTTSTTSTSSRTFATSGLFGRRHHNFNYMNHHNFSPLLQQQRWNPSTRSAAVLRMVLTTPESIIEQASTKKLLDILIDESVRTSARRPIMMQFDPSSGWIWRRWKGTVFSETWISCVRNVIYALFVLYIYRTFPRLQGALTGFNTLWGQLLSVTTFTLTFFVNQSYALWRKCYELSRRLQGRLHDIDLTLACHAARKTPPSPSEPSTYTSASRQLLDLVSRYVRLFNLLTYASFTRSHRPILTPRGMRRLVERGLMTPQEREILIDAEVPATQRHNCILMWITRIFIEGRQAGHFTGGSGFEQQFMEKIHVIRAQYGAIGDELQGRMPLAYAHIVQVLVDCVLMMYPLMAFSSGMSPLLGVLGTGLLTTSYQGLFDLAKQFLDPYDNENYGKGEDPLCVDTLIAETNAGSLRWMYGFEQMPVSSQRIKDGELFDYLLPVRGYTVEELEKMEQEKIQKELDLKELRQREEAERLKAAEEKAQKEEEEGDTEVQEDSEDFEPAMDVAISMEETHSATQATQQKSPVGTPANEPTDSNTVASRTIPATSKPVVDQNTTTIQSTGAISDNPPSSTLHKVYLLESGIPVSLSSATTKTNVAPNNIGTDAKDESIKVNGNKGDEKMELNKNYGSVDSQDFAVENAPDKPIQNAWVSGNVNGAPTEVKMDATGKELQKNNVEGEDEDGSASLQTEDDPDFYVSFDSFDGLPWFDEVGPDGQEVRLSQMLLADEEWEEEKAYALEQEMLNSPLTPEEFSRRKAEIIEAAEKELLETEQILASPPGFRGREVSPKEKTPRPPSYDQTKLDGISQLWGLPPENLDDLPSAPPPNDIPIDDNDFSGVFQLWGRKTEAQLPTESTMVPGPESFDSISQLWDGTLDDDNFESTEMDSSSEQMDNDKNYQEGDDYDYDEGEELDLNSYYEGLEWHTNGQGDRLSQMLADEVWDYVDDEKPDLARPISLEEYTKKVVEILETAENEILETEAILRAPPGADSVAVFDRSDEGSKMIQAANETTSLSLQEEQGQEEVEDYDLDALEMDKNPDKDFSPGTTLSDSSNVTGAELSDPEQPTAGFVGESSSNTTKTDESADANGNSTFTASDKRKEEGRKESDDPMEQ